MFTKIVVGVGKTDSAKQAARVAADLAQRYEAELHLVMAYDRGAGAQKGEGRSQAEAFLTSLNAAAAVPAQLHVIAGDPADTVLMVAQDVSADLIVVGNRGMKGARRVLGSVPNTIAHGASCAVLIADTTS